MKQISSFDYIPRHNLHFSGRVLCHILNAQKLLIIDHVSEIYITLIICCREGARDMLLMMVKNIIRKAVFGLLFVYSWKSQLSIAIHSWLCYCGASAALSMTKDACPCVIHHSLCCGQVGERANMYNLWVYNTGSQPLGACRTLRQKLELWQTICNPTPLHT